MTTWTKVTLVALPAALAVGAFLLAAPADENAVTLSGGHDIGKDDHGRPGALIAAALGVNTEVFREAFGGVTPAKGRSPTEEARMKVLGPHGVSDGTVLLPFPRLFFIATRLWTR